MRLTVVGSGTAAPHAQRVSAAHWLEAGSARVLLDCGNGALHRMAALAMPWHTVTHVALTHFHVDHVGDFPALLVALRYGRLPPRETPLQLIGPRGTIDWFRRVGDAFGALVADPGFPVHVREIAPGEACDLGDGVSISAHPVPHTGESVAYSVTRGNGRLVYTGDTGYDEAFATWARGCSLLLCECSLPSSMAIPGHLTPESVGALAARVQPARLVLTHMYPPLDGVDVLAAVSDLFAGPTALAHDGMAHDLQE